jgi:RNA-directed DNA polymerase
MTVKNLSLSGASSTDTRSQKDKFWSDVNASVRRFQMRIAKAVQEGRHNRVKALQWLLTHSFHAKLLATKRVTENRGAKTAGVDGHLCRTRKQKIELAKSLQRKGYRAQPLRRIYIPKKNSSEKRPLSIPTMKDRAMQALHLLALEPIVELRADPHAYGFRPKRGAADAIEQCFRALARRDSARFILEGDIRKCFDQISHFWLQANVPMDKGILAQWLAAGFMDKNMLYPTSGGTPQGGVASPCLALMALSGLEQAIKAVVDKRDKVNVAIYADDFIVTGKSVEILEQKVKPAIVEFLKERNLELSETKTKITTIDEGFDFLGFNIRKYKDKLLIKPAKKNIHSFLTETRRTIKRHHGKETYSLIQILNAKIRGWAGYYKHVVSKDVFGYIDDCIYRALARWVKRRHPEKNAAWWEKHYFRRQGNRNWVFFAANPKRPEQTIDLLKMSHFPISRHVQIKGAATPYDERWLEYFAKRKEQKLRLKCIQQQLHRLRSGQVPKVKSKRKQLGWSYPAL